MFDRLFGHDVIEIPPDSYRVSFDGTKRMFNNGLPFSVKGNTNWWQRIKVGRTWKKSSKRLLRKPNRWVWMSEYKSSKKFNGDGSIISVWPAWPENWKIWTDGCETGCAIVFGMSVSKRSLWEKKPERKRKNLIRLGVDPDHAYAWSRTRMGGWAVAQSLILVTTISLKRLAKRGYKSMLEYYLKVSPSLTNPPERFRDGVRGVTPPATTGGAIYSIRRSLFLISP